MRPPAAGRAGLTRRRALALAAGAWLLATGHAPYGQWGVYRKRFLLVLTTRADPPSYELGERVAAVLADRLPESRARVSRAPHAARVASLIASKQMDVALMRPDDAAALRDGAPPFAEYGPVPLETIVGLGEHLLVCRDDFPARHAWLIAAALSGARGALGEALWPAQAGAGPLDGRVPLHRGARAYFAGGPAPDPEPEPDRGHEHGHDLGDERGHGGRQGRRP
jgi:hypothetical protein